MICAREFAAASDSGAALRVMMRANKRRIAMHTTRNDLPEPARAKAVELLNDRLADAIDLHTQLKHAHWNVKGPQFIALHELFDKLHDQVEEYVDDIAERAVSLAGKALGTARLVAARSKLPEFPATATTGREHLEAVANSLASFGKAVRAAIDAANELRDADTADLFTGVSRGVDKALWFVEAHLQASG
jgi:starvation-inducible DNA-binding protein